MDSEDKKQRAPGLSERQLGECIEGIESILRPDILYNSRQMAQIATAFSQKHGRESAAIVAIRARIVRMAGSDQRDSREEIESLSRALADLQGAESDAEAKRMEAERTRALIQQDGERMGHIMNLVPLLGSIFDKWREEQRENREQQMRRFERWQKYATNPSNGEEPRDEGE